MKFLRKKDMTANWQSYRFHETWGKSQDLCSDPAFPIISDV